MLSVAAAWLALTSENHDSAVSQRSDCTDRPPTTQICITVVIWGKGHVCEETICLDKQAIIQRNHRIIDSVKCNSPGASGTFPVL